MIPMPDWKCRFCTKTHYNYYTLCFCTFAQRKKRAVQKIIISTLEEDTCCISGA